MPGGGEVSTFEEFTERAETSKGDASVKLRARKTDGRPALIVSFRKKFIEANPLPIAHQDRVDVLIGTGDSAGKLRLRKTKGKGCGAFRRTRLGGFTVDCGFISALPAERRPKAYVEAVIVDGCIEVTLPSDDEWKAMEGEGDVEEPGDEADEEPAQDEDAVDETPEKDDLSDTDAIELRLGIAAKREGDQNIVVMHGRKLKMPDLAAKMTIALAKVAPNVLPPDRLAIHVWGPKPPVGCERMFGQIVASANGYLIDGDLKIRPAGDGGYALSKA